MDSCNWWREEFELVDFGDVRLKTRLVRTADQLSSQPLDPINKACPGWADTKATYRLFANEKVNAVEILNAHRDRTWERARQHQFILSIQDTSFLNYTTHEATDGLGKIGGGSVWIAVSFATTTITVLSRVSLHCGYSEVTFSSLGVISPISLM